MISIIVCVKQVLDPEAPTSSFRIDPEAKRAIPPKGTPPVLNPFDENALEAALKIKDSQPARITVISMGHKLSLALLRKSLAVGADELVVLEDSIFDKLDSYFTACVLTEAIRKVGKHDLILCGREAADSDAGQVGSGIAEIMGIPSITIVRAVTVGDGVVRAERLVSDGYEIIEAKMPVLITVSSEVGNLRSFDLKKLMEAQKKAVTVWNSRDLGMDLPPEERTSMLKLFIPVREVRSQIIDGESPEKAGENLALKLREVKII